MILDPVFTRAKGRRGEVKATKLNHTKSLKNAFGEPHGLPLRL
jgi:hypothetical protein